MRHLLVMILLEHALVVTTAFRVPVMSTLRAIGHFGASAIPCALDRRHRSSRLGFASTGHTTRDDVVGDDRASPMGSSAEPHPVLSFPGGGIFFWWQAGAITALQERYDMSSLDMVGASAGALAATLAACDADMELAMTLALNLCDENEVSTSAALLERAASVDKQPIWSRPLGLAGVWGAMVEDWLDELLPADADKICLNRVHLLVLGMWPQFGRRLAVSDFSSKEDLIKTCMASVHIPYFMNKKFTARHRGSRFVDGSFRASREALSLGQHRPTVYIDHKDDEVMVRRRRKFLKLTNRDGLLFMQERGYNHVQAMLEKGKLDCLDSAALPEFVPRRATARRSHAAYPFAGEH